MELQLENIRQVPVDYVLFIDGRPVGLIEVKKDDLGENITVAESQSERYVNSTLKYLLEQTDTVRNNMKSFPDLDTAGFRNCQIEAMFGLNPIDLNVWENARDKFIEQINKTIGT